MKPNKDFRLSKSAKRLLATKTGEQKGLWKKLYIESEMAEKQAKFAKLKERSTTNQGEM
mgnify:CR=1 FL=1|jgi:hypothetical protein